MCVGKHPGNLGELDRGASLRALDEADFDVLGLGVDVSDRGGHGDAAGPQILNKERDGSQR
jgi:hypothetical protein